MRVSEDGTVIGVTYGTAIITAKSKIRPTLSANCSVTVKRPAMTLKESSVELYVGETKERVLTPVDNRIELGEKIEWTSSDENIVTVEGTAYYANVTAHSAGVAEIIATIKSEITGETLSVTKRKVTVETFIPVEKIELRFASSGELLPEDNDEPE